RTAAVASNITGGGTRRPRPAGKAVGAPPPRGVRFAHWVVAIVARAPPAKPVGAHPHAGFASLTRCNACRRVGTACRWRRRSLCPKQLLLHLRHGGCTAGSSARSIDRAPIAR